MNINSSKAPISKFNSPRHTKETGASVRETTSKENIEQRPDSWAPEALGVATGFVPAALAGVALARHAGRISLIELMLLTTVGGIASSLAIPHFQEHFASQNGTP